MKAKAPEKFCIHGGDHKVLALDSGTLKAVPNKSYRHPETFFVLASHLRSACEETGSPILLAVSKGELGLCSDKCRGQSRPSLQLKKKKLKDLDAQKEQALQLFIFYRAKAGSWYTLELAAYPRFICTSSNSEETAGVTDSLGKRKHTEFAFHWVYKAEMNSNDDSN
ncbi:LOW QUALITY PROTEIN: interleukin-37 [Dugong dugon]